MPVLRQKESREDMPSIGLGTWELIGPPCRRAVEHALSIGYRHIDTANGYDNENDVGEGLRRSAVPRHEVFVTTKVWVDDLDAQEVQRRCEESLRRLGTDYLDLVLVHWPPRRVPLEIGLGALFELQQRGAVRHVGVSNFPRRELARALELGAIFCNQIECHPYLVQPKLTEYARERNVTLTAYSPLARGAVMQDPTLVEIGRTHHKSPAQVALRWLLQQPGMAAVPKAADVEHQKTNLDIFDFELDSMQMAQISALGRGMRLFDYAWAPQWDD